ncbi:MAG: PDZ domain-containing protein [Verrucomicrobiota bacterium]
MEKNKKSLPNLLSVKRVVLFAGLACSQVLVAQESLETFYRLTGAAITDVFEPQRQAIQTCSAVIYNERDEIAYGIVISKDGYILTKASEIQSGEGAKPPGPTEFKLPVPSEAEAGPVKLSVRVDKQSFDEVKIISVDPLWDVALIKVDAQDLTPAVFAPDSKLEQGSWVVVNGATSRTKRRVLAGIISAKSREIPTAGGAGLGVTLENVKDKLQVKEVTEGSGAKAAGVQVGDLIVALEEKKVSKIEELAETLKDKKVGDEVKLTVKRAGKNLDLTIRLAARGEMAHEPDRNDQMSGDFSKRRSGFPRVIQHDILANSDTMGGPVLDMKGRVVGMNIARANRCETFAIPVEELQMLAKQMVEKAVK